MVTGETIVLAYAVIAYVFAYLAINLSDEHGPLRILYLLMSNLTVLILGFMASSVLADGDSKGVITAFNNGFAWIFYLVVAYFVIYFLYELFKYWSEEAR